MDKARYRPVIARAVFLEKKGARDTGRLAYAFLLLDEHGQIVARPFVSKDIREMVAFVLKHKREACLGRVTFEPPDGIDAVESKHPRRYQAIDLHDIFYASATLGQS